MSSRGDARTTRRTSQVSRSGARALAVAAMLCCSISSWPDAAHAAELELDVGDAPGTGFHDPGPPDPVATEGGNPGQTLGEQRLIAFQFAADLWGALLDNDITVTIDASMSQLECDQTSGVLGSASPINVYWDPERELWYPSALANALAGEDLDPTSADIEANFNSRLDSSTCLGDSSWYYGLDGQPPPSDVDFLSTVLHELAHGLGFISFYDYDTGEFIDDGVDVFSSMVYDLSEQKFWPELTDAERAESGRNVRNLVWAGQRVQRMAPAVLPTGYPGVHFTPAVPGFSGVVNEADLGATSFAPVSGELVLVDDSCDIPADLSGKVVLMMYQDCLGLKQAASAGASAVLYASGVESSPPGDLLFEADFELSIPLLHINQADLEAIAAALAKGPLQAELTTDAEQRVGADDVERVMLNATDPTEYGSSVDHWDAVTRRTATLSEHNRDLLMEPAGVSAGAEIDLTAAFFADLGWSAHYCGDGTLDEGEACDDGDDNSAFEADACRPNCQLAGCGDHTVDSGEACDQGAANGGADGTCLDSCQVAACGDGVKDPNEECDEGELNSDQQIDACRSDCKTAHCGDGVADTKEECDGDSFQVEAPVPLAVCLGDCSWAWCGNGRRESGEQCDDGQENGTAESRCSPQCVQQLCGDGIQDGSEECDDGAANSNTAQNTCRTDCMLPRCGDNVRDRAEECDDGNLAGSDGCSDQCEVEPAPIPNAGTDVEPPLEAGAGDNTDTAAPTDGPTTSEPVPSVPDMTGPEPTDDGSEPPTETTPEPSDDDTSTSPPAPTASPDAALLSDAGSEPVVKGVPTEPGCGCRVGAESDPSTHPARYAWLVALALAALRRRRASPRSLL